MPVQPRAAGASGFDFLPSAQAKLPLRRPADRAALGASLGFGLIFAAWAAARALGVPASADVAAGFAIGVSGTWWLSNTVAHIHIHTPLFRPRRLNQGFALFLTAVSGIPQSLWRARHLWHHAGEPAGRAWRGTGWRTALEAGLIGLLWCILARIAGQAFWVGYLPGYLLGLGLCALHGHFEHASPGLVEAPGTSHYGRWYNRLWFNDGYHAEHHLYPTLHWSDLPARRRWSASAEAEALAMPQAARRWPAAGRESRWPPVLRWLEECMPVANALSCRFLGALECLALPASPLQRYLLRSHETAMRRALAGLGLEALAAPQVVVVGGGGYPRTLLVLRRILPGARIVALDSDPAGLQRAQRVLADIWPDYRKSVTFRRQTVGTTPLHGDLVITPLAFRGDRGRLYEEPPAGILLVHDWLWRPGGDRGVVVSPLFLKRLNVVLSHRPS